MTLSLNRNPITLVGNVNLEPNSPQRNRFISEILQNDKYTETIYTKWLFLLILRTP